MIDTAGFFIKLSFEQYEKLLTMGVLTERIDRESGFVEFEYTNFRVSHSWNYKVMWRIDNKHWVYDAERGVTVEQEGCPYLRFEFSAPKVLSGHNLETIDIEGFISACAVVRVAFEKVTGVDLPGPGDWFVYRLDLCANFVLDNLQSVKSYIRYLQRLNYPRRKGTLYPDESLYFPSRHNTLKVYAKGPEFKAHDACRFLDELQRKSLQNVANKILRIEVEMKGRIKYLVEKHEVEYVETFNKFKGCVSLEDFLYIVDVVKEVRFVMKRFLVGEETKIMRSLDVYRVLTSVLSVRVARSMFAIYMLLVTQGQREVKRRVPERTYYRALSVFRKYGISVIASDVEKNEDFREKSEFAFFLDSGFPSDFSLDLSEGNKYYQLPKAA